eukprot:3840116-Amphidinium_carterae.1
MLCCSSCCTHSPTDTEIFPTFSLVLNPLALVRTVRILLLCFILHGFHATWRIFYNTTVPYNDILRLDNYAEVDPSTMRGQSYMDAGICTAACVSTTKDILMILGVSFALLQCGRPYPLCGGCQVGPREANGLQDLGYLLRCAHRAHRSDMMAFNVPSMHRDGPLGWRFVSHCSLRESAACCRNEVMPQKYMTSGPLASIVVTNTLTIPGGQAASCVPQACLAAIIQRY